MPRFQLLDVTDAQQAFAAHLSRPRSQVIQQARFPPMADNDDSVIDDPQKGLLGDD
ncbi:hypothetical protein [Vreelandella venusta]|uniref:hypothetical protein n=1 Tax=Vreelandella venusta TaxID=44935 RepID=UPI00200E2B76|nr:hypothetical protein [Halomonas venusta]MBR9924847.1 hypothetical protein [Gammaproteobacteria bacterium]MDX1356397.1 hypothetical protein [Halomonas venusta]UQI40623.1 hypothetical protein M3L73_20825 [Halomonas venusta]